MLLDDLVGVIETLKERIATHGASLGENETRTRMALIDPLLRALGWDVSDPDIVTPEYSVGASRADYALLTSNGNPAALVEAKKLDESLASHRMQMLNYANISGIPYAGLTDGNHWEMYTVFDQAPIEQRRILDVSIANTPAHEAALKLLLLWRPNLASGQPAEANEPILIVPPQPDIVPPKPDPDPSLDTGTWISLANIKPFDYQNPPTAIRFSKGETLKIAKWRDVVVEVLKNFVNSGSFTVHNCPWFPKGLGVRVNTSPFGANGQSFRSPAELAGGIYVETHGNRVAIITRCRNLWDSFGDKSETVELQFE